ncbi:MAG: cell division protein FtsZ [Oscillospiraceae bacterium]|nr:cell division protein FtsZ [Oscillospiraceae bacterium]
MAKFEVVNDVTDEMEDEIDALDDELYNVIIKVIGVGGGGGNALEYMAKNGIDGVEYIAINTDVPALRSKDKRLMRRMQIGKKKTKGRGAGGNPEVGSESALEDKAEIEKMLADTAMVFVSAGMGGGTGTGAAPVIAQIAKEMGILTIGVVTKPFDFERQQKMNTALKGIVEMRKHVDALIVIPNQKLLGINEKGINIKTAFEMVDNVLYKVVKSISAVLNETSYINVDFSDVESTLKDSGVAHIAIGTASGENKVEEAVAQVINSPLLETSIENAGKMLVHITMSGDAILDDVNTVIDNLTQAAHLDVDVITGVELSDELKDTVEVTVVATSFRDDKGGVAHAGTNSANKYRSEPIEKGSTQQLRDAHSIFGAVRSDPSVLPQQPSLDKFITQSLDSTAVDDDPFRALDDIFRK